MPLKKGGKTKKSKQAAVSYNIRELIKDNKKKGKARGAGGKKRSMTQIKAIALKQAGLSKKNGKK